MAQPTPNSEIVTSLDGYHMPALSDPPTANTADCELLTEEDYVGRGLILAEFDDHLNVLGLCGNTGLGTYYYGCLGGGAGADLFVQGDPNAAGASCNYVATGEEVVAQICKTKCEGFIPFSTGDHSSIVLIAKIGEQWFIVNVLDRGFITNIPDFKTPTCADACCGIGLKEIEVTIGTGCGSLSGQVFRLYGDGGVWTGGVTAGGDTFSMTITCTIDEPGAEDWTVAGGCGGGGPADDFNITCEISGLTGDASFSGLVCSQCTAFDVTFVSVAPDISRPCDTIVETGVEVIMEACGLPTLEIGDQVVMALIPKLGSTGVDTGTGTGTGTGCHQPIATPQWQMIQTCNDGLNCGAPCPPPPPSDVECCEWTDLEVPEFLTGILSLDSDDPNCVCSEPVTFQLSTPVIGVPHWDQVPFVGDCSSSSGSGTSGNALLGVSGLIITCGEIAGTGTGTGNDAGTGTGTGLSGGFSLTRIEDPNSSYGANSPCDVLLLSWSGISTNVDHCDGGTFPPNYVTLSLEVTSA
jgi:hypothetical protein|tara:strand:- start:5225 stop:6793 length:1569 start_codon:yes stop_codon:yes gene_type:complete